MERLEYISTESGWLDSHGSPAPRIVRDALHVSFANNIHSLKGSRTTQADTTINRACLLVSIDKNLSLSQNSIPTSGVKARKAGYPAQGRRCCLIIDQRSTSNL